MILRAKTATLFSGKELTKKQQANSNLNMKELESGAVLLESFPRRLVLELTNACNLNCLMCGRNATDFKPTHLEMDWFWSLARLFDTVEEVTLMGWGEPTFHPNFVEMLEILDRYEARKYFCTNGMRLGKLMDAIFSYKVDVFAVSIDGATKETNGAIRVGSDLDKINGYLREIIRIKQAGKLNYPYINYVFCAMKRNLHELPQVVEMAAEIGLDEVKTVFLTAFDEAFVSEVLYDCQEEVGEVFEKAAQRANALGVLLKLPYVQGEDPAGDKLHRDCFVTYRDFYLGSDGYVRPCMSTSDKFFLFDPERDFVDMWNAPEYQHYREAVNTPNMHKNCRTCYQSSHCNWNNKKSFYQDSENFAPVWE